MLVELPSDRVVPLRDALVDVGQTGLTMVPAARTLLIEFDPLVTDIAALSSLVRSALTAETAPAVASEVTITVRYDGADLQAVAEECAMSVPEVVRRHLAAVYTVQFCGFSPGFGYLTGLDPRLRVPRLASPRASVSAGSVALADEYTGIYPRSSPGGWRLIGRTDAVLFDLDRTPPALLTPGTRVRFVE